MRISPSAKLAVRTLWRHPRRTLLSVLGIGIGCGLAVFFAAFMRGTSEMRVRSIAESGFGHLRIAPGGWEKTRENNLRLQGWKDELGVLKAMEGIKIIAPHTRAGALLAFGTKVAGVEMVGVDPAAEYEMNRLIRALGKGRYLHPDDRDATVVGKAIAERLDVELEDDLFLTVAGANGKMEYAMLHIVGIVDTGSRDVDASICHVTLEDIERYTGLPGTAEITLVLEDPRRVDEMAAEVRASLSHDNRVLTWKEVVPGQGGDAASDRAFANLLIGIVIVVVILGIASAQLTAILERKRELAVIMALGMGTGRIIRLLLIEALALGIIGTGMGLLLATPFVHHWATNGFNFAAMMRGEFNIEGVLFEPIVYCHMGLWMIPHALLIALISTLVAALYPAWFAIRTDPTSALSLREA